MNHDNQFDVVRDTEGRGPFICTYSGRFFHPFDPTPDEVHLVDIAHALSMKCRWNGHIKTFYSVAEHSIEVMKAVQDLGGSAQDMLQGLLHDASEAYSVDMPSPIKREMPDFIRMEDGISRAIAERYGFPPEMSELVHRADKICLYREAYRLFPKPPQWVLDIDPADLEIAKEFTFGRPMPPQEAETAFRIHFGMLTKPDRSVRL